MCCMGGFVTFEVSVLQILFSTVFSGGSKAFTNHSRCRFNIYYSPTVFSGGSKAFANVVKNLARQ